MIVVDSHLDLAMNALRLRRDLTKSAYEIRELEQGMPGKSRSRNTVALPEMREGKVALCFATANARLALDERPQFGFTSTMMTYAAAQGQLAYYRTLEFHGELRMVQDRKGLATHIKEWQGSEATDKLPVGYVLSVEGADCIVPEMVESWWKDGLRIASLSYGVSRRALGRGKDSYVTEEGRGLLRAFDEIEIVLDLTHLYEGAFWQALEIFRGPVIATHQTCQGVQRGGRQFTDEQMNRLFSDQQIRAIIERGGVLGVAMSTWLLDPGWVRAWNRPEDSDVTLETVVEHVDHICQLAGNARHAAIGSDLDGGFGKEESPKDLDTIADLQRMPGLLRNRGYSDEDVALIMHGNWIRKLHEVLPP